MADHKLGVPRGPRDVEELDELLSRPPTRLVEALASLDGDIAFLGVGGKMGPTMARMAKRAFELAGSPSQVIGISRFRDDTVRQRLESWEIHTVTCDLMDERQVRQLPDAANIVSMSGFKFGASEAPESAWAANCLVPAMICRHYGDSRIVAFSTGNVYGMVSRDSGGSVESDPPRPDGEYSMTALGRERIYEYYSKHHGTPVVLLRLNYATELRYGVLVDLAQTVWAGQPVDVSMSYVNVIWLADANAMTLAAFPHTTSPARTINLAGPDIVATRDICTQLGQWWGKPVSFVGEMHNDALLNNGQMGYKLLGHPVVSTPQLLRWTADWIAGGGPTLGKPTHFQTRSGKY